MSTLTDRRPCKDDNVVCEEDPFTKKRIFRCGICQRKFASKQNVLQHLFKAHDMSPVKKMKKKYREDTSLPIPERTAYRWKGKSKHFSSEVPSSTTTSSQLNMPSVLSDIEDMDEEVEYQVTQKETSHLDYQQQVDEDSVFSSDMDNSVYDSLSSDDGISDYSDCELSNFSDTSSSNVSSSDTDDIGDDGDEGIPVREFQSLSLLSCFLRNQFTTSACQDVVQTLRTIFKDCEDISRLDLNEMMSYVDSTPVKEVHYCVICNKIFPDDKDSFCCNTVNCEGLRYKGSMSSQQSKSRQPNQSFVFADVKKQLVDLLQTPGIWEDIQERKMDAYERLELGSSTLTDITDGSKYREMMTEDGFLDANLHNITGVWNTDGVNLYSSSKVELWPIFLAINELSPPKRFSRDNTLLIGIWQGKGKPPFETFLTLFSEEMNSLYDDGVQIQVNKNVLNVKLAVLCGVFDLPAKAEILNMSYFNGQHSCIKCEEPGITVKQGKGHTKCFPYKLPGTRLPDRSHDTVLTDMRTGNTRNRSKGFKGMSGLMNLKSYDLVLGTVPDYMHGILLGVTKTLLNKWFSPCHSNEPYFIGKSLKEISHRMKKIKPPDGIERLPRDLEKHYNHFKATELQSWMLYYAYPCIQEFLKEEYLENFVLLSEGIHILLRDDITQEMMSTAADLLDQFYSSFQHLYGNGSCGLNIHNAGKHLVEYVKLWGPLWAWSCFPFEDNNAMLLQAVHGTGLVSKQIMKYRQAQACIRRRGLNKKTLDGWKITHEAINCQVAGALKPVNNLTIDQKILEQLATLHDVSNWKRLDRVIVNEKRFYSEQYSRMKRRICSIVLYGSDFVGRVKYFILCDDVAYGVVEKMVKIPPSQLQMRVASHFIAVKSTTSLALVNVDQLREILVLLNTGPNDTGVMFVVRMPNRYGHAVFK